MGRSQSGIPLGLGLEKVTEASESRLVRYCAEHGSEHDPSFLPGRDFILSPEHPAYLLLKDGTTVGEGFVVTETSVCYALDCAQQPALADPAGDCPGSVRL